MSSSAKFGEAHPRESRPSGGLHLALFGSLVDPGAVSGLPEASEAANRFQLGLVRGLLAAGVATVTVMTALPVATSPRPRPPLVRQRRWDVQPGVAIYAPGFLNIPPIKPFLVHHALRRAGLRNQRDRLDAVISYNPSPGPASAGLAVARRHNIPFVAIVADYTPKSQWSSPLRAAQLAWARRLMVSSDGLVVLSAHTGRDFAGNRPWIKIDGGLDDDWLSLPPATTSPKTIVYAGTPAYVSGIRLLLDAFALIPEPDVRLVISGRGGLEDDVRSAAARDRRIRVAGFLDRGDMQHLLRSATVLVNPRLSQCIENRYNFPSKLLDYLASGRPVITTLAGDLDVAFRYTTLPLETESPAALAALLVDVCSWPEERVASFGATGRAFVRSKRTWNGQASLVLEFVEKLIAQSKT